MVKSDSPLVRWATTFACLLALAGCQRARARRSIYYWRTSFSLTDAERGMLARHHVERIYLRMFDVTWDRIRGRTLPVARCAFTHSPPVAVVPVVYVENRVFENEAAPSALAAKVWREVESMARAAGFAFEELQVDCDWTVKTRQAFFTFCRGLQDLAHRSHTTLSATIRLHQIKYPARTGVPPVGRGMLMFYNMGTLAADAPRSSIYNAQDAARYLGFVDRYPVPLDAALPIFSWAIHAREGRVIGLVEKLRASELDGVAALQRREPSRYVASRPTLLHGNYLQQSDTLALETMSPALTLAAARQLARHFHPRSDFAITLFDLDERNLEGYADRDLEAIYTAVR